MAAPSLQPGDHLGPYKIQHLIGEGGMGQVYQAFDPRLERLVAIKILPDAFADDPDRVRRFRSEALAAGALAHQHILTVFDVGTEGRVPYLVSELLQGASLSDRLVKGKVSVARAVGYVKQAASGLAAAHAAGVVHRDIKPENLFLCKDGRIKILDFGVAKMVVGKGSSDQTQTLTTTAGTVVGTASYMSPEQIQVLPVDRRSDIFSLGCVLYQLLSGSKPFVGQSAVQIMSAIVHDDPRDLGALNPELPRALLRIVTHCLEKEPAQRFQSAEELEFALDAFGETGAGSAPLPALLPKRRWKGLMAVAVALLLLAAGTAGWYFSSRAQSARGLAFRRLTFRRGRIQDARFTRDVQGAVFSASWEQEPSELFETRFEAQSARPLNFGGLELRAISPSGDLALLGNMRLVNNAFAVQGDLSLAPVTGGTPRTLEDRVDFLDWAPDGRDAALVRETSAGIQLEFPSGNVIYKTGGYISDPRVSPDGQSVAFLDHPTASDNAGSVMVVTRTGARKKLAGGFSAAEGLAWEPGGKEVWFTASRSGLRSDLRAVTLDGRERVVHSQSASMVLRDISKDGKILFLADDARTRLVMRKAGEDTDRDLSWWDWSLVSSISPDGGQVAFFESGEGAGQQSQSFLREVNGKPPVLLGFGSFPVISPDGKLVNVSHGSQVDIYPFGMGRSRTVSLPGYQIDHSGSLPDGRKIWFVGAKQGEGSRLYLKNIDDATPPQAISPDGVTVSGLADVGGQWLIGYRGNQAAFYSLEGGAPLAFPGIEPGDRVAYVAKDLAYALVYQRRTLPAHVVRVQRATGVRTEAFVIRPTDSTGIMNGVSSLQILPDGKSYTYSYMQRLSELYLAEMRQ